MVRTFEIELGKPLNMIS